jgi:hypothetical protein
MRFRKDNWHIIDLVGIALGFIVVVQIALVLFLIGSNRALGDRIDAVHAEHFRLKEMIIQAERRHHAH